ncbi:MAG: exosortase-associated EpsI family protein [Planctomycetes bacterium]|nr:exosortase-associated EpsI family protein [Planctomycetota bacterium]
MAANLRSVLVGLRHPPFLACVVVLVGAIIGAGPVAERLAIVLRKQAVPLRQPLNRMDKANLGPYRFIRAYALEQAVVDALGTDLYIDWEFKDERAKGKSPLRRVRLFVTYYTGRPDLVPHTPDQCWLGAGYEIKERGSRTLDLHGADAKPLRVPVRAVTFQKSGIRHRDRPTVVYTFHCNGKFVNGRTEVRRLLANPWDQGAYFCKIEVRFGRQDQTSIAAGREETIEAAGEFLDRVLPVLLRDHLPDWEVFQAEAKSGAVS